MSAGITAQFPLSRSNWICGFAINACGGGEESCITACVFVKFSKLAAGIGITGNANFLNRLSPVTFIFWMLRKRSLSTVFSASVTVALGTKVLILIAMLTLANTFRAGHNLMRLKYVSMHAQCALSN